MTIKHYNSKGQKWSQAGDIASAALRDIMARLSGVPNKAVDKAILALSDLQAEAYANGDRIRVEYFTEEDFLAMRARFNTDTITEQAYGANGVMVYSKQELIAEQATGRMIGLVQPIILTTVTVVKGDETTNFSRQFFVFGSDWWKARTEALWYTIGIEEAHGVVRSGL